MSDWSTITGDLAAVLRSLPDDGFVTLTGSARGGGRPAEAPAKPGILARLLGRRGTDDGEVQLFVQFRRTGVSLYAECLGGPQVGGRFPWTQDEHEALLAAGWEPPPPIGEVVYIRFFPTPGGPATQGYLEGDLAEQAADLAVRTLRDVAREEPAQVEVITG